LVLNLLAAHAESLSVLGVFECGSER